MGGRVGGMLKILNQDSLVLFLSAGIFAGYSQKGPVKEKPVIHSAARLNSKGCQAGVPQEAAATSAGERLYPKAEIRYCNSIMNCPYLL